MSVFAERLKEAMVLRHYRQIDVANATHIDKGTISNYLNGKYEPKNANARLIARALNVNLPWLLGYEDVPMEVNQYVEYSEPKEEDGSYTTFEWEEGFEEKITKDVWTGYYDSIVALPDDMKIDVFKYVLLYVTISDMKKRFESKK